MKLPFQVSNRHGSVLAAFAHEADADEWARRRAESTYQTPVEVISVRDMTKTVKMPNGRLHGELVCEYDGRPVSAAPQGEWRRT